jgi:hypothetical protein
MKTIENQKEIEISGNKYLIKKLPLRGIKNIVPDLRGLLEKISPEKPIDQMKQSDFILLLIENVEDIAPVLIKISNGNLTAECILDDCGIEELTEILKAISEVNNVKKIFESLKKLGGGDGKKKQA